MAGTNVGNDGYRWTSNRGEPGNLAGVIHTQLKNKYLGILWSRKYRKWQANKVVVIAGGSMNTAGCADATTEHFFGGSLTDRSGYAHNQPVWMGFSPGSGKSQQKRLTVIVSGLKNADSCGSQVVEQIVCYRLRCHYNSSARLGSR